MRETGRYGVEAYLKKRVLEAGGMTRKWVSPGHVGVPDQIVIWTFGGSSRFTAEFDLIETKATNGVLKSHQVREHQRLRRLGCRVFTLYTKKQVDAYVKSRT